MTGSARFIVRLSCLLAGLLSALVAHAGPLVLDDTPGSFDAWPAVRMLADPDRSLTIDDAGRRAAEFTEPQVRRNNFGPRRTPIWLRVPLRVTGSTTRWVLEVDYPPLNRIDAWLITDGRQVHHATMGSGLAANERPMRTRSHAVALDLAPGDHEVVLRVESATAVVVPIRLHRADAFVAYESGRLLLQGLMFGFSLTLLITSIVNGVSLRDKVFGYYALMLVGVSMFFVSFSGLGHQFVWNEQTGMLSKTSPWGALLALTGASLFVVGALEMRQRSPWLARGLNAVAVAGGASFLASFAGLLDYPQTALAATVLGPIPILLALVESTRQARQGSRIARYTMLGWGAYSVGALAMAAMLRGLLPVDFLTQHLFQFSSLIEMFAWMRVLAIRIEDIRRDAERTAAEKSALVSLAHTDALTGLPNRRGLDVALDAALSGARTDNPLALYLLDLDGFKAVNDRLGHDAGDELLVQVARRLRTVLRASDLVARLGGDEFVVMLPGVGTEAVAMTVGQKMLDAFKAPFEVGGQSCRVGLTIGFALAPNDGRDPAHLLRRADAAMYAGKQDGRQCIRRGTASAGLAAG